MKRLALWAVLVASLSANLAAGFVALRQRRSGPPDEPLLFSRVALTPDQRARIAGLRAQLDAQRADHARRMADLRARLGAAMMHQADDRAAMDSILRRIAESQTAFQQAVVDHVLAVRGVLQPEQRPAFEAIVAQRMQVGPMQCGFGAAPEAGASR